MTGPLQVGELLGRYRLLERIGAGGMAEVFLARLEGPEGFARKVAIKVVHPDTRDDGHLLSLVDEARVAGLLRHPNIVQVHELERRGEGFYLVMEYLEGRPLDQLLRGSAIKGRTASVDVVIDVGLQVLDALAYAHAATDDAGTPLELVHRDIKPSNLMISDRGLVTVVDFGIARAATLERRTETGVGKGTPAYMSPEQLTGAPVGPSADLFSLATVLYEMATGHRLFQAGSLIQLVHRRQVGIDADDVERLRGVDQALAAVVLKGLDQDPTRRWQSADAMADALRELTTAHPRTPLRGWIGEITDLVEGASGDRSLPTRQASVAATAPDKEAAGVRPRWVEKDAEPGVVATRLVDRTEGDADPVATRAMPKDERPRAVVAYLAAGGIVVGLVGLAFFLLEPGGLATPEPTPGPVAVADPSPEPTPEEPPAPTPVAADPTPPPPESTPAEPSTPEQPTPEPTPEPPTATPEAVATISPPTAKASVYVNIVGGGGGQVEIEGHGRRETPGTFRVPPGRHVLRLLDQHDGLLADYRLAVGAGEDARCLWKRSGATLTRVPDPDGAPCDVQ